MPRAGDDGEAITAQLCEKSELCQTDHFECRVRKLIVDGQHLISYERSVPKGQERRIKWDVSIPSDLSCLWSVFLREDDLLYCSSLRSHLRKSCKVAT